MIKVSVFYPATQGGKFNMKYYLGTHVPSLRQKLGDACKGLVVDRGVRGGAPNTPAHFVVICNLMFEDVVAFQTAFRTHADEIMADVAKFSSIQPRIQISEMHAF
jgi:uncharacterized protein (TIGR02118 family)